MLEGLAAIALAAAGLGFAVVGLRATEQRRLARSREVFELAFPRELEAASVVAFVRSLSGLLLPWWRRPFGLVAVVLEVVADREGIRYRLFAPRSYSGYVLSQLRAAIPGVRITAEERSENHGRPTLAGEVRLASGRAPLRVDQPAAVSAAILGCLHPLGREEQAWFQWVISPSSEARVSVPEGTKPDPAERREAREKQAEPLFLVAGRLGVRTESAAHARQLLRRLTAVLHIVRSPGARFARRLIPSLLAARRLARGHVPLLSFPCVLNAAELAELVAFPIDSPRIPGLVLGATRQLPPAPSIPSDGRVLARATFPGAERPLAISITDSLRHVHVLGPTGVGKSTLLLNLIVGDMAAGRGVAVVDPKGDLVAEVLERVPSRRERDVIVLDPTDAERPVGLNVLAGAIESPELVADHVVAIFHKLYAAFWGPRTDDILRAALLTLVREPGMTLCEVPLLLTDEGFRRRLVGSLDDPIALEPFWAWYEALSVAERAQAIGPVMNKLRTFLLRRRVRNVIGQAEPALDLEAALRERKVLLVSLAKGLLGEEAAALLGSLVVTRLWQAVQRRAGDAHALRHAFFCHIDEFQDYLNLPASLADVLAQARGFGFGLTLAHQHLGQLPASLREAVLANARTKVVFQTSATDARLLAREFAPHLVATDLQGLGPYEVVVAASAGGHVTPPATGTTFPPPAETGRGEIARHLSRERFGRPRDEVEAAIRARIERPRVPAGVGRRRRS